MKRKRISAIFIAVTVAVITVWCAQPALAQDKPNILVIMGDDIGYWNLSYNPDGMAAHNMQVGELLKQLDNLRISDNTIIL